MAGRAGRGWRGEEQGELVEEVGVGLAQVEGDRARRVIGDDPCRQVAPLRVLVARWCAEDGLVVDGNVAEAELALETAAEVRCPHERAVGVPDSRRSVNVYVVPPSAGRGSVTARSGTSVYPCAPPALRNATSPS